MSNELKIKILRDSQGNNVNLSNITIDAADALKIFIESLTELAKTYEDVSDITLKLDNGSIEACLIYPEEEEITNDIDEILAYTSTDRERVKIFRTIQDKIQLNGLEYEVYINKTNEPIREVTQVFKGRKFTKVKQTFQREYSIDFLEGVLYAAGGKSTVNIHIENAALEKVYKIECTKSEAKKLNERLYSTVYLSVLKICKTEHDIEYRYIDSYLREENYNFYKSLHESLIGNENITKYDLIYDYIVETLNNEERPNEELVKLIRLYNNKFSEKGIVRTILMTLKPIINSEMGLKPHYDNLVETFRSRSQTRKI